MCSVQTEEVVSRGPDRLLSLCTCLLPRTRAMQDALVVEALPLRLI
jgi:hypothetical protein